MSDYLEPNDIDMTDILSDWFAELQESLASLPRLYAEPTTSDQEANKHE